VHKLDNKIFANLTVFITL